MLSFSGKIFLSKHSRPEKEVFDGLPKLAVIMSEIFYEVCEKEIERLSGFGIFLSAVWTESFFYCVSAILAGFVFSDFSVAHG